MTPPSLTQNHHLAHTAEPQTFRRRHELDWLRVLIIIGLIPFHVIGLFAIAIYTYDISGGQPSRVMEMISGFFGLWPMSLLFLVSGASTWFALGRRTPRRYIWERVLRLFVPFVFATLVLIPMQVYAVLAAYPQLISLNIIPDTGVRGGDPVVDFYPAYLAGYGYFLTHFSSMRESIFWGHIWFVPRLLLYALATVPVLLWLRGEQGKRFIERFAGKFVVTGTTLLLGLTIALPRVLAAAFYRIALGASHDVTWDSYNLWSQLAVFLMYFLIGYIIYASPLLLQAVRRDGPIALALGLVTFVLLETPLGHIASVTEATPGGILMAVLRAESEWLLVVGVLSVGLQFFAFGNNLLDYLNEAAYPLYVLHMPSLVLVGLTIITWNLPGFLTMPLVALATFGLTLGLYEYVVKRVGVLRLLFGLKPLPPASAKPV